MVLRTLNVNINNAIIIMSVVESCYRGDKTSYPGYKLEYFKVKGKMMLKLQVILILFYMIGDK